MTALEDEDKLVLTAIEAALPRRRLGPEADVFELVEYQAACFEQFARMSPIQADESDGAVHELLVASSLSASARREDGKVVDLPAGLTVFRMGGEGKHAQANTTSMSDLLPNGGLG